VFKGRRTGGSKKCIGEKGKLRGIRRVRGFDRKGGLVGFGKKEVLSSRGRGLLNVKEERETVFCYTKKKEGWKKGSDFLQCEGEEMWVFCFGRFNWDGGNSSTL